MSPVIYWYFHQDYRGTVENYFTVNDEDDLIIPYSINIKLPNNDKKFHIFYIYVLEDDIDATCTHITSTDDQSDITNITHQIHSKINGHGVFKVTGMTPGYRQTGSYGDPVKITNIDVDNFTCDTENHYPASVIVIDNDYNILDDYILSINPSS